MKIILSLTWKTCANHNRLGAVTVIKLIPELVCLEELHERDQPVVQFAANCGGRAAEQGRTSTPHIFHWYCNTKYFHD